MSSSILFDQNRQSLYKVYPYLVPPLAASAAIVPAFRDMVAKSAQQKGQPIPHMTIYGCLKGGLKIAPTTGMIVGTQMIFQSTLEKAFVGDVNKDSLFLMFVSSAIVGTVSAPFLAIFNGQTMGWTVKESFRKFSLKQGTAIVVQETAFVIGLSAADRLAVVMKQKLGNNQFVDYFAAFIAGALGSIAGHPANTILTRLQNGMVVENSRQLMWGAACKARAVGIFSVVYKFAKEVFNYQFDVLK